MAIIKMWPKTFMNTHFRTSVIIVLLPQYKKTTKGALVQYAYVVEL